MKVSDRDFIGGSGEKITSKLILVVGTIEILVVGTIEILVVGTINSVCCHCRTVVPLTLLAASYEPFSAPRGHPHSLPGSHLHIQACSSRSNSLMPHIL